MCRLRVQAPTHSELGHVGELHFDMRSHPKEWTCYIEGFQRASRRTALEPTLERAA